VLIALSRTYEIKEEYVFKEGRLEYKKRNKEEPV
jgi:hypothetical protein